MVLPTRVCSLPGCEREFTPRSNAHKYCCEKCSKTSYNRGCVEYKRRRKLLARKGEDLSEAERDFQASIRNEMRGWPACKFCSYCMDMSWRRPENKPCPGCRKYYAPKPTASYDPDSVLRGTYDWC